MEKTINKNGGVQKPKLRIHLPKRDKGERFEAASTIDWSLYLPTPEGQKFIFDTNACMTFSSTNVIETQLNYMKATGQIPQNIIDQCTALGYFDANGKFNFSDRFSANLNGTDPNTGNGFDQVWSGHQTFGLLPESDFPYSMAQAQKFSNQYDFWYDYYDKTQITQAMKDKALKFLQMFNIEDPNWIIVSGINGVLARIWNKLSNQTHQTIIQNALQTSPVHVAIPACPTWNTGTVLTCAITEAQHGVMIFDSLNDGTDDIFDQYNPYTKVLANGYTIPYAVSVHISVRQKPVHTFSMPIAYGNISSEVTALQQCLAYLGYFKMKPTGYYGAISASAVYRFQKDYAVALPEVLNELAGRNVGPRTIEALNKIFSK